MAQVKGAKVQIWRTIPSGIHHVAFQTSTVSSSTLWCSTLTHTSLTILDINIKSHGQMYAHRTHSKSGSKSYRTDCYIIPSCKLQLVNPFSKSQYTKVLTLNKRFTLHLLHLNILSMHFKTLQIMSSIKVVYHNKKPNISLYRNLYILHPSLEVQWQDIFLVHINFYYKFS